MDRRLDEALKVLGVPAGSDRETVNNAYRRLARVTHPDVSPEPDAAERFATVTAAYRLVSASSRPPAQPGPRVARPSGSSEASPRRSAPAPGSHDPRDLTDAPLHAASLFPPGPSRDRPPIVAGPVTVRRAPRGP